MPITVITIVSAIFAIAAAILAFIFIVPEEKRSKLNKFGQFLHDVCNFKFLILEKILKFLYVLSTAYTLICGFFMLFWVEQVGYYYSITTRWNGYIGLIVMIFGPIVIRIAYEFFIMLILAVNNIIQINNKMRDQNKTNATPVAAENKVSAPSTVQVNEAPAPQQNTAPRFCTVCGTLLDENKKCPNCSKQF